MSKAPLVDDEFRSLLPALTPDQRAGLERDVLAHGIISPLVVWEEEGVLLDGHNRLEIAEREGLTFRTVGMSFATRDAAVEWIFANQRDRRNLTPDQLALIMGRHYNRLKAAPYSRPGNNNTKRGRQKVDREFRGMDDRLAKEYGVSDMTIQRAGKFAAAVETLRAVDPDIEAKVVTGKGPTRKAVIAAAAAPHGEAEAILAGTPKREKKTTLEETHGFKSTARRPNTERADAAVLTLETAIESLGEINPERLNGDRLALAERLCEAAKVLARLGKAWKGDGK